MFRYVIIAIYQDRIFKRKNKEKISIPEDEEEKNDYFKNINEKDEDNLSCFEKNKYGNIKII